MCKVYIIRVNKVVNFSCCMYDQLGILCIYGNQYKLLLPCCLCQVYYTDQSNQLENTVDVYDFTGTYTLDNLKPYTEYSVYVTATRAIGDTGRFLEGDKSETINQRTLAGSMYIQQY